MRVRWGQPAKALKSLASIEITLSGMTMLVSEVQSMKTPIPIEVTPSGMVILVRETQLSKANESIQVRLSGRSMLASEAHPEKVLLLIMLIIQFIQANVPFSDTEELQKLPLMF